jgi:hypothetical protein
MWASGGTTPLIWVTPELGAVLSDQFDTPAALHPGKETFVRIEQEVRWGPEPLQILWKNKVCAPPRRRIEPGFSGYLLRGLITVTDMP